MSSQDVFLYDLCIVGAGMVGSAAARYASMRPGTRVCLIGPPEPEHRTCRRGDEIFGTHYDSSRITSRSTHINPFWGDLAKASISQYKDIERKSGIKFYHQLGYMSIGCSTFLDRQTNTDFTRLTRDDLRERLAYMEFSDDDSALFDIKGGWIDPRKLVDAEILVASKQGCDVIRDVVCDITEVIQGEHCGYKLQTEGKLVVSTRKVLLTTNVFTLHRNLLPQGVMPKFLASPQTIVLGEVDDADLHIVRSFPSIVYHGRGGSFWPKDYPRNRDGMVHFYSSSIAKYPDGKHYIKLGHSDDVLERFLDVKEVSDWYCSSGDPILVKHLTELLQSIFTGIKFKSFKSDACVTMVTPTTMPYIDKVGENMGVAIGDNGYAAKSCDALGRHAAHMMLDCMSDDEKRVQGQCPLVTEDQNPPSKL